MDYNSLKEGLFFYNPWWTTENVPRDLAMDYHRPVLGRIISYLDLDRIVILKGSRRTGKTTLLYQLIENLLQKGVNPKNILFLSFDDPKVRHDVDEIIKAYQEITKKRVDSVEMFYLILDEVQFLEGWQFSVKKYFDRKYPIKFIISGSAATLIKRKSESLAGRTIEEIIFPFSFYEYFSYQIADKRIVALVDDLRQSFDINKLPEITSLIPHLTEIKIIFNEYIIRGGFPNLFGITEDLIWKKLVREDIIEKVIYKDLVDLYDIKKPEAMERLFLYLIDITAQILNVTNIANSIDLSREYTEKYLIYFEQAFLIKRLKKYAKSVEKIIRSSDKVHIIDPGLINAFAKVEEGQLLESVVASHLMRVENAKLYYFREKYELDFVLSIGKDIIPMEIKNKVDISGNDLRGLRSFAKRFKTNLAIVVTKERQEQRTIDGVDTLFIPAWLFLLLLH